MLKIGIDIGASCVKFAALEEGRLIKTLSLSHRSALRRGIREALEEIEKLCPQAEIAVTGSGASVLTDIMNSEPMGEIPAIALGTKYLCPQAGCVMEIGSQNSRFITELDSRVPRFSVNEHCAGGTGSFFEDQMSRLGMKIEDYSAECEKAKSIPRLSGRCSVFAKTDIIHRQQEGVSTPDILLGLCYAMIRNYKAVIVRDLPVIRPVAFCGGVTENTGVQRAIREVFRLNEDELIVPENALFAAAAGAALKAEKKEKISLLISKLNELPEISPGSSGEKLPSPRNIMRPEPVDSGIIPPEGCALGIDIGSTSTNLVLVSPGGELIHHQYLRTSGDPEAAVRLGLNVIKETFGDIKFISTGITGSGRQRLGKMMGVDAVRDEITAQAKAASALNPETDTIFEIGGQDSKFISLRDGEVADFQMNKICAAGTGSFIEEQAARMAIPLEDFGPMALEGESPVELGERCTVFIETAIASAGASGVSAENIAAGLCRAIVRNYLHKVAGSKKIGKHIVLQGGVAYNPGIVAAFASRFGERLSVSPYFPISGAYGAALLSLEAAEGRPSSFHGLDSPEITADDREIKAAAAENSAFYNKSGRLLLEGYDGSIDPKKKTVGIPYVLMMHKLFPMANAFFKSLGFNVLLSNPTDENTVRLSQEYAQGETCYPVKLVYGHMQELAEKGVDYIFLPSVRTMKHESSGVKNNYGCVYMQTAALSVARALKIEERGIELLNPVFDLDFGKEAMASAMLGIGKKLGIAKPLCAKALLSGAMAVRKHTAAVEQQGRAMLSKLRPEDKLLVLITRNYGLSDPVLNMGIPELLLERGYKVITLSHLPAHDLDLSRDYPNLYWPFGQHIISGVKMVAHHPNLYAVCLNNHGCGPDTMLSQLVKAEMGDKPYLQIEVDEHFSRVGVITRVEAFLNSLSHRPAEPLPADFDIKAVAFAKPNMRKRPDKNMPLFIPPLGNYTRWLGRYYEEAYGVKARPMAFEGIAGMELGRAETSSKEYLPFPALLDAALRTVGEYGEDIQLLIPESEGAEADGAYARSIRAVLDRKGLGRVTLISPVLEEQGTEAADTELLIRALIEGDMEYAGAEYEGEGIPQWDELEEAAEKLPSAEDKKLVAAVGTPMCLTSLDDGVLEELEAEEFKIIRASLAQYLLFMWHDKKPERSIKIRLDDIQGKISIVSGKMGRVSPFSADLNRLAVCADAELPRFAGANGRYRWAMAVELSERCSAVLTMAPRYENTAAVLDMRKIGSLCRCPLFQIALDGDWDESSRSRLRSFLYYC